jgi:hypothetical protein
MLSRFFLLRPVFAWVIAIILMVAGGLAISFPADLAVSAHCAAIHRHPGFLSRRVGRDGREQCHPDHRAEDDGLRQDALPVRDQRLRGRVARRTDLRARHRSRPGLVAGPEQTSARDGEPAGRGAARGHQGQQKHAQLPHRSSPSSPRTAAWTATTCATTPSPAWRKCSRACPASARSRSSAASMPCASGSNPDKLMEFGMTMQDVVAALRAYNVEVSAGQFGGAPAVEGQRLNAAIIVQSLLKTPDEFANIPLRTNPGRLRRPHQGHRPRRTRHGALMTSKPTTTANRPPPWPSVRPLAPMRWKRPTTSGPSWPR